MVYETRPRPNKKTKVKAIESHSVEEILQSDQESSSSDVEDVPMPSKTKVTSSKTNKPQKDLEIEAPLAETVRQSAQRDNPSRLFAGKRAKDYLFPQDNSEKRGSTKTTRRSTRRSTRVDSSPVDTNVEDVARLEKSLRKLLQLYSGTRKIPWDKHPQEYMRENSATIPAFYI